MTEALIAAHMAARRNGNAYAIEMIEVLLRHAGSRLSMEFVHGPFHRGDKAGLRGETWHC